MKRFGGVVEQIEALSNKDEPDFRAFRQVLSGLSGQVDSKLCRKIIDVLKRSKNHYDDEPRFIICLNPERQAADRDKRKNVIETYKTELEELLTGSDRRKNKENEKNSKKKTVKEKKGKENKTDSEQVVEREHALNKLFEGYKGKYRKFFQIARDEKRQQATGYRLKQAVIDFEHKFDGVFALLTTQDELDAGKIVDSYKNLKEVETFFDDL